MDTPGDFAETKSQAEGALRKKGTYGSLWFDLTRSAEESDLDFIVNGSLLTAEISFGEGVRRISAHLLKDSSIAWFDGAENLANPPAKSERLESWMTAHVEDLTELMLFVRHFSPEDADFNKYNNPAAPEDDVEQTSLDAKKETKKETKKA